MKDALESRIGARVGGDWHVIPWLVAHAASMINRLKVDETGRTAHAK